MYISKSPLLLIVFNRPEQTRQVLNEVRKVQPPRLYIAADAPRLHKQGEVEKCRETLALLSIVDWPCDIKFKINETNLGSHTAIPNAIDWFFSNESEGIVLEDDCIPHQDFFRFCDQQLDRFRDDSQIMWINGSSLGFRADECSHCFSAYAISWGWASWRRAWSCFADFRSELPMGKVESEVIRRYAEDSIIARLYWQRVFKYAYTIKNWDYRWLYAMWSHGGLACSPPVNLISNIGFGIDAVHGNAGDRHLANLSLESLPEIGFVGARRVPHFDFDSYLNKSLHRVGVVRLIKFSLVCWFPWLRNLARYIRRKQV